MNIDRRTALLRHAEFLIKTRGYSSFSYADLAESVSIRKASVHHHFPTKQGLGITLVKEYIIRFQSDLDRIDVDNSDKKRKLIAYSRVLVISLNNKMLPICGALSAEFSALLEDMQKFVSVFFAIHLNWLRQIVSDLAHSKADVS